MRNTWPTSSFTAIFTTSPPARPLSPRSGVIFRTRPNRNFRPASAGPGGKPGRRNYHSDLEMLAITENLNISLATFRPRSEEIRVS